MSLTSPIAGCTDVVNTLPAPYNGCLIVGVTHYPTWARYIPLLVFEAREHSFPCALRAIELTPSIVYSSAGTDLLQVRNICSIRIEGYGAQGPFQRW